MNIRTRYAPSPTGFLHLGGARTALFCYLFARNAGGVFIVRIEDTDFDREVQGGIDSQLHNLAWLGIEPDESVYKPGAYGPYKTSEKLERYVSVGKSLLETGHAYECFCTPQQLEAEREEALANHRTPRYSRRCLHLTEQEKQEMRKKITPAIRLKMDDARYYRWNDLIRGEISFPGTSLTDPVLLRSTGVAMYNFAVSIDDHDMAISHILRGEEHIANTPYQIAVKEALGWGDEPVFYGHLSIIIDSSGKKLSKRNKELKQFLEDYRREGYPSAGVANFLALLGWSPSDNKEIKSLAEIARDFDLKNVSTSPAMFDQNKLDWVCTEHLKAMSEADFMALVLPFSPKFANRDQSWVEQAALLYKPQVASAKQLWELVGALDRIAETPLSEVVSVKLKDPNWSKVLKVYMHLTAERQDWSVEGIKESIEKTKALTGAKGKDLFMPIRLAVSGQEHGPELPKLIYLIGKERILERLKDGS